MTSGVWFDRLCIVIGENHGYNQVQKCEFVKWFLDNGTIFNNWHGQQHPSGPNYRTLFSGVPWSSNEFDDCWRPSILDEVPNYTIAFAGQPADRHNPAKDMHSRAVSSGPGAKIVYLGMDDNNNSHDGPLELLDSNIMKAIDCYGNGIVPNSLFVLTFDEAFGLEYLVNRVFTAMAGPMVPKGKRVGNFFTHSDFARGLYNNWGIPYHNSDGSKPYWTTLIDKPWWEFD